MESSILYVTYMSFPFTARSPPFPIAVSMKLHSFSITGFFVKKLSIGMPHTVGKLWVSSRRYRDENGG